MSSSAFYTSMSAGHRLPPLIHLNAVSYSDPCGTTPPLAAAPVALPPGPRQTIPFIPATSYQTRKVNPTVPYAKGLPLPLSSSKRLESLDSIKVPPITSSVRAALFNHGSDNDWHQHNADLYESADHHGGTAEMLGRTARRICSELEDQTKCAQADSEKRLAERLKDVYYWSDELKRETDCMLSELENMDRAVHECERVLVELENPLRTTQESLYLREKRHGSDLVRDQPERELTAEALALKQAQECVHQFLEKLNIQHSIDRDALREMERDSELKFQARVLDEQGLSLRNTSRGIAFHNGIEIKDTTTTVPETWAQAVHDNVTRSQSERAASQQLRSDLQHCLDALQRSLLQQWARTDAELNRRIQETLQAKNEICTRLGKVMKEINGTKRSFEMLKMAIREKEAPLKVAQTRLELRNRRVGVEHCRDHAQQRLVEEVTELNKSIDFLKEKLTEAQAGLHKLLKTKCQLEAEINTKN